MFAEIQFIGEDTGAGLWQQSRMDNAQGSL